MNQHKNYNNIKLINIFDMNNIYSLPLYYVSKLVGQLIIRINKKKKL
jgi:hypothetical protein